MNILFLTDIVPYPPNTGIKIRTYNIIKELHKEHAIYLMGFNHKVLIPTKGELERAVTALSQICKEVSVFDIPSDKNKISYFGCLFRNLFHNRPYRVDRYYSKQCILKIQEIMELVNIDLVHLDKTELYQYMSYIKDTPCVATNHNVESQLMKSRMKYEVSFLRRMYAYIQYFKTKKYEKEVLNEVNGYITCTEIDLEFFKQQLNITNRHHAVIENGVDISHYSSHGLIESDYFLIIGAQSKEATANYDATIYFMNDIWPEVIKAYPEIKLKIVGRNPSPEIINFQKVDKRIEIVGFVEDERAVLEKALALLVPLRLGGGSRLKILTAMSMGKTVISTSIGAEGICFTDRENILIEDNPYDFANQIINIAKNKELREFVGQNARKLIQTRYDWNIIGEKINMFYQGIVGRI